MKSNKIIDQSKKEYSILRPDDLSLKKIKKQLGKTCYEKNVFVMMPCGYEGDAIERMTNLQVKMFGLDPHIAERESISDKLDNVFLHAVCSKYAIAVFPFERIKDRYIQNKYYNPNVCVEIGFLRALNKQYRIVKDWRLGDITDVREDLYHSFDTDNPETVGVGIEEALKHMVRGKVSKNYISDHSFEEGDGNSLSEHWVASNTQSILQWKNNLPQNRQWDAAGAIRIKPLIKRSDSRLFERKSLCCRNNKSRLICAVAHKNITFSEPYPKLLSFGGWSKALLLRKKTRFQKMNHSEYCISLRGKTPDGKDIKQQYLSFNWNKRKKWQFAGKTVSNDKGIKEVSVICLFRSLVGEVLFDKLFLRILE